MRLLHAPEHIFDDILTPQAQIEFFGGGLCNTLSESKIFARIAVSPLDGMMASAVEQRQIQSDRISHALSVGILAF